MRQGSEMVCTIYMNDDTWLGEEPVLCALVRIVSECQYGMQFSILQRLLSNLSSCVNIVLQSVIRLNMVLKKGYLTPVYVSNKRQSD
jgi:hypothetical protein